MKYLILGLFLIGQMAMAQSYSAGVPLPGLPVSIGPKPMSGSTSVTLATDQNPITVTGTVQTQSPLNLNASFSSGSIATTTTAVAPANTVYAMIEAIDVNTANIRVAVGAVAGASNGFQLQPGRSEIFNVDKNVSLCPESGTQSYVIQWISQ